LKRLLVAVAVLFSLLLSAYIAADRLVDATSRGFTDYLKAEGLKHGVRVLDHAYEDALLVLPSSVYWRGVEATMRFEKESFLPSDKDVEVKVERISLHMDSLKERTFRLRVREIMVSLLERSGSAQGAHAQRHNLAKGREATISLKLDSLSAAGVTRLSREIVGSLKDLLLIGRTPLPVTFSGTISFPRNDRLLHARIMIERRDEASVLVMDEEDVVIISRHFNLEQPLTEAEVKLVSRNPLKAHRLFQIRTYARRRSRSARRADSTVPQDAYRHVLWSYLLTQEYGEDLAEEVTDAHEQGKTGNTREEMSMDLANNRIGREYARRGRGEDQLLELTFTDPRVVREPGRLTDRKEPL
jgi:hypothetical protein